MSDFFLTPAEHLVYRNLAMPGVGARVRLEQECIIRLAVAWWALKQAVGGSGFGRERQARAFIAAPATG
jgi:hypothetical protein